MSTAVTQVNLNAEFPYAVDVKIRGTDGKLRTPTAGEVTGLKMRLALLLDEVEDVYGPPIHAELNDLTAVEDSGKPGRFMTLVSQALHRTRVLPLIVSPATTLSYYAVYSIANKFDLKAIRYVGVDREST